MAVPIVVTLLGLAVQWGTLSADVRYLERCSDTKDAELARVSAAQASVATHAAPREGVKELVKLVSCLTLSESFLRVV